jgi:hypothetical protein
VGAREDTERVSRGSREEGLVGWYRVDCADAAFEATRRFSAFGTPRADRNEES